jgi:hypothetical protein
MGVRIDQPWQDKLIAKIDYAGICGTSHIPRGNIAISNIDNDIVPDKDALLGLYRFPGIRQQGTGVNYCPLIANLCV